MFLGSTSHLHKTVNKHLLILKFTLPLTKLFCLANINHIYYTCLTLSCTYIGAVIKSEYAVDL